MDKTLFQIVKSTLRANPNNSVIGFKDNSSAIKGFSVNPLRPQLPGSTSLLCGSSRDLDILQQRLIIFRAPWLLTQEQRQVPEVALEIHMLQERGPLSLLLQLVTVLVTFNLKGLMPLENCNVVKEIIYPNGADIDIRAIIVGDHTMSVLEIWGAEYQEQDALLVKPESRNLLQSICEREQVSMAVIGIISGSGRVILIDSLASEKVCIEDIELEKVLGDMPQKTFEFNRSAFRPSTKSHSFYDHQQA